VEAAPDIAAVRRRWTIRWGVASTLLIEGATIAIRFISGVSAVEFNKTAPLWQQIHHMFWCVPLLVIVPFVWRRPRICGALLGLSIGLVLSDLAHHFIALPILVGNTGWHWP
jgi:hypothetical protein